MFYKQRLDSDPDDTVELTDTRIATVDGARISKERVRTTPQLLNATSQLKSTATRGVYQEYQDQYEAAKPELLRQVKRTRSQKVDNQESIAKT